MRINLFPGFYLVPVFCFCYSLAVAAPVDQPNLDDSVLVGIWHDYGGCLTRGSIPDAQWREERVQRLHASKEAGFNTLFVPPRDIEMELAFAAGWKTTHMLVLASPDPGEGTTTYGAYIEHLRAYFGRYGNAFRGVYIDEPSDVQGKWFSTSEGESRIAMLLKVLKDYNLPLYFSGYSYFNLNDMLGAADYTYPWHSGKRLETPLSHSGLFDGVRVYDTLLLKYGIQYYVLDDSWSLPTKTRFEIAADQRPVLQLFSKKLPREMLSHPNLSGGGMFINMGYDLGTFSKVTPRAGDPMHFEQLLSEFKELHRQNPAMKILLLYCGDLYNETLNRMRAFYIRYRATLGRKTAGLHPDGGCTENADTVWDETLPQTPCNVFRNLVTMGIDDYDTLHLSSGAIQVQPKVDDGSIFRLCYDTSDVFKAGFLNCLLTYLSHFPPGNEEYLDSPFGRSSSERNLEFRKYIEPEYSEAYIRSLEQYFMECSFYRDLVCRLYTLRFDAYVYTAKKTGIL